MNDQTRDDEKQFRRNPAYENSAEGMSSNNPSEETGSGPEDNVDAVDHALAVKACKGI